MKKITAFITFAIAIAIFVVCYFYEDIIPSKNETQQEVTIPQTQTSEENLESFACITADNTYLYSLEDDTSGLFILPKTYFVKVLARGVNFTYIQYLENVNSYQAINGYCKTDELTFVDYIPEKPYLYYSFPVEYYCNGYKENPTITGENTLYKITVTAIYYGDFKSGTQTYCYILRDNTFGYILKNETVSYQMSTEYEQNCKKIEEFAKNNSGETGILADNNLLKIVAVCSITALVLFVLFFVFKKEDKQTVEKKDYYVFDEHEKFN